MHLKITFIILFLCVSINTYTQSYLTENENYLDPVLINPAIAGSGYITKITASVNKQWMRIQESPVNYFLSGQIRLGEYDYYDPRKFINKSKFKSHERVGLGAGIYTDIYGPFQEYNLHLTYSYHLSLNNNQNLSFGISGKLNHYAVNQSKLNPRDPDDPLINFENLTSMNFNTGAYYYHKNYFFGISLLDILNIAKYELSNTQVPKKVYVIGGYRFRNDDETFVIEPKITYGYAIDNNNNRMDFHTKFQLPKYGWLGLSYLNNDQLGIIMAIKVYQSFYLGYRFTGITNNNGYHANDSHGIVIGKNLGIDKFINNN